MTSMKEVRPGESFRIIADAGTEEDTVWTMLDPRLDEGETEIGPLVNVTREGVYGRIVLIDMYGPVRIVGDEVTR